MLLIVGNDLVGIEISIFQLLVVAATLEGIAGAYPLGHLLVELADSKSMIKYLLFSLERIFSL